MMKSKLRNILFSLLFLTSAYSFADIPEWVTSEGHYKYPASQYFIGVGIAEQREQAIDRARSNLMKEIKVKIESELKTEEKEITEGGETESLSSVISRTKSTVDATVSGIEVGEIAKSENKYYVLAILNKSNYFNSIKTGLDKIISESNALLQSARENSEKGLILNSFENYKKASDMVAEYYPQNNLLVSLTGQSYKENQIVSRAEIQNEMQDIISKIDLELLSGADQTGISGEYLPAEISVKVVYKNESVGQGVNNFPLIARYKDDELIDKVRTTSDGVANFRIKAVPTGMTPENGTIEIQLAAEMFPFEMRDLLSKAGIEVSYQIRTPDLKFSLETRGYDKYSAVQQKAANIITESGFEIDEQASLKIKFDHDIVNRREINSPFGTQYLVEIRGAFALINQANSQTIATYTVRGKGLSKESQAAAEKLALKRINIRKEDFLSFLKRGNK